MHFTLPPATKPHSSYQVKLQKELKSTQKQASRKKDVAHAKKDSMKSCEIQVGGPKVAVMVG